MTESVEPTAQEQMDALYQKRRRGCILRMIGVWLAIMFFLVLGIIFVRSNVERDSDVIHGFVQSRFELAFPERFKAYSMNHFFGTLAIAYWDQENVREDERTLNVISFFQKSDWRDLTVDFVEVEVKEGLEHQLSRNEFHAEVKRVVEPEPGVRIFVFEGQSNLDEKLVSTATCFRFVQTIDGPIQIQTLGLRDIFPVDEQIKTLTNTKPIFKD